jgi:hypothetical protein
VELNSLPRVDSRVKPDFMSSETQVDINKFYKSHKALGQLFRAVEMPTIRDDESKFSRKNRRKQSTFKKVNLPKSRDHSSCEDVLITELSLVSRSKSNLLVSQDMKVFAERLLIRYSNSLDKVARSNSLSWSGKGRLSEAELFVGSINASTSQYNRRRDLIAKMRTETKVIGEMISVDLRGEEVEEWKVDNDIEIKLDRAWAVIALCSTKKREFFGASIIQMVAVSVVFEMLEN